MNHPVQMLAAARMGGAVLDIEHELDRLGDECLDESALEVAMEEEILLISGTVKIAP